MKRRDFMKAAGLVAVGAPFVLHKLDWAEPPATPKEVVYGLRSAPHDGYHWNDLASAQRVRRELHELISRGHYKTAEFSIPSLIRSMR